MRSLLLGSLAVTLLLATACGGDDDADDDGGGTSSSSSSGGGGGSSSSSGAASSSGSSSSSSGAPSSSSSSSSSSGEPDAGPTWPGPPGTALAAGTITDTVNLSGELSAHFVAAGASDGSFAVLFLSYPDDPAIAGGAYVEKHAKDGALVWSKPLQFTPTSSYTSLAMDVAGNVYVAVNVAAEDEPAGIEGGLVLDDALDDENLVNVRPDVGDCDLLRFAAADGKKQWHGQITLGTNLTAQGVATQCRGLAVRDDQLLLTGVYPTRDVYYVQGATSVSAIGNQPNSSSDPVTSFAFTLDPATGAAHTAVALVATGTGHEWSVDGTALATDGRALIHGLGLGTTLKVGVNGSGDLAYSPSDDHDDAFYPAAFLDLQAAPPAGHLRGSETLAVAAAPDTFFPQVVALPDGAALFGLTIKTYGNTAYRPLNAGTPVALPGAVAQLVLTRAATDVSPGETRVLGFGASNGFPQHFLGAGSDGSVAVVGLHEAAVDFGAGCDTTTLGTAGSYLLALGTTPLAGCKFALPLPAGVSPSRVAFGADGRIFVAGIYENAVSFGNGVSLPAPEGERAPFFVSFVP